MSHFYRLSRLNRKKKNASCFETALKTARNSKVVRMEFSLRQFDGGDHSGPWLAGLFLAVLDCPHHFHECSPSFPLEADSFVAGQVQVLS
jgi:hypothetical protein